MIFCHKNEKEITLGADSAQENRGSRAKVSPYAGVHIKIDGYFRLLSKSFPFAVYYGLDGDTINVYAVLDCRRNQNQTIEQLKKRRV